MLICGASTIILFRTMLKHKLPGSKVLQVLMSTTLDTINCPIDTQCHDPSVYFDLGKIWVRRYGFGIC